MTYETPPRATGSATNWQEQVHGCGDIYRTIQEKLGPERVRQLAGLRGSWIILGVGSKPHDSPALGVVDHTGAVTHIRRTLPYASAQGLADAGSEQTWAQHRVWDAGRFSRQSSPGGTLRIVGIDDAGRVFTGPATDTSLLALKESGYEESRDPDFAGGALMPNEILLYGAPADYTPEDGSYSAPPYPIDAKSGASGAWDAAVSYWSRQAGSV